MIKSYRDYLSYIESDMVSLERRKSLKELLFDDVWKFQRLLRKIEYVNNCTQNRFLLLGLRYRYSRLGKRLGFTIPINVFGPGLSIAHYGTVVVNDGAKVGANCRLHVCVTIGTEAGQMNDAPQIGDNCYIGPGAKIFGRITLGDNLVIAANAVVNKSFPDGNMTIGGVPARKISDKTSEGLIIKGYRGPINKVVIASDEQGGLG